MKEEILKMIHIDMSKEEFTSSIKSKKIIVVGDLILDQYYYGSVERISPEAPVPINKISSINNVLGGAGNVARNLATLGCQVDLYAYIGDDNNGNILKNLLKQNNINDHTLTNNSTITKIRIIGNNQQQMLRLDFEEKIKNNNDMNINLNEVDAVIISDYNKGFCSSILCKSIIKQCNLSHIPVIVDTKCDNWSKFNNATYITPNKKEFDIIISNEIEDSMELSNDALRLIKLHNLQGLLVTQGKDGLSLIDSEYVHIPANQKEVFDVSGAGDTVIAIFTLMLLLQTSTYIAADIANSAAQLVITKLETSALTLDEFFSLFK